MRLNVHSNVSLQRIDAVLMAKPQSIDGYSSQRTAATASARLATLLPGLGTWGISVFLVGGLTPRYLIPAQPPTGSARKDAGGLDSGMRVKSQRWAGRLKQQENAKVQLLGIGRGIQGLAPNALPILDLESTALQQLEP